MMKILKNPAVIAILVGLTVFVVMLYFNKSKEKDNDKKKKKKKKNNDAGDSKESSIIIATLVGLVTWYGVRTYMGTSTESDSNNLTVENNANQLTLIPRQTGGNPGLANNQGTGLANNQGTGLANNQGTGLVNSQGTGPVSGQSNGPINPRVSSSDTVRSYQILGSGLNIPKGEIKIPNVMIDYN